VSVSAPPGRRFASAALLDAIRRDAQPLTGAPGDHDALLDRIGGARVVALGESTHGTHEFYRQRAVITKRLIEEHGFHAVADDLRRALVLDDGRLAGLLSMTDVARLIELREHRARRPA